MKQNKMNRNLKGGFRLREDGTFANPHSQDLSRRGFLKGLGAVGAGVAAAGVGLGGVAHADGPVGIDFYSSSATKTDIQNALDQYAADTTTDYLITFHQDAGPFDYTGEDFVVDNTSNAGSLFLQGDNATNRPIIIMREPGRGYNYETGEDGYYPATFLFLNYAGKTIMRDLDIRHEGLAPGDIQGGWDAIRFDACNGAEIDHCAITGSSSALVFRETANFTEPPSLKGDIKVTGCNLVSQGFNYGDWGRWAGLTVYGLQHGYGVASYIGDFEATGNTIEAYPNSIPGQYQYNMEYGIVIFGGRAQGEDPVKTYINGNTITGPASGIDVHPTGTEPGPYGYGFLPRDEYLQIEGNTVTIEGYQLDEFGVYQEGIGAFGQPGGKQTIRGSISNNTVDMAMPSWLFELLGSFGVPVFSNGIRGGLYADVPVALVLENTDIKSNTVGATTGVPIDYGIVLDNNCKGNIMGGPGSEINTIECDLKETDPYGNPTAFIQLGYVPQGSFPWVLNGAPEENIIQQNTINGSGSIGIQCEGSFNIIQGNIFTGGPIQKGIMIAASGADKTESNTISGNDIPVGVATESYVAQDSIWFLNSQNKWQVDKKKFPHLWGNIFENPVGDNGFYLYDTTYYFFETIGQNTLTGLIRNGPFATNTNPHSGIAKGPKPLAGMLDEWGEEFCTANGGIWDGTTCVV